MPNLTLTTTGQTKLAGLTNADTLELAQLRLGTGTTAATAADTGLQSPIAAAVYPLGAPSTRYAKVLRQTATSITLEASDTTSDVIAPTEIGLFDSAGVMLGRFAQATPIINKDANKHFDMGAIWDYQTPTAGTITYPLNTIRPATASDAGIVELATSDEVSAQVDAARALTPDALRRGLVGVPAGGDITGRTRLLVDIGSAFRRANMRDAANLLSPVLFTANGAYAPTNGMPNALVMLKGGDGGRGRHSQQSVSRRAWGFPGERGEVVFAEYTGLGNTAATQLNIIVGRRGENAVSSTGGAGGAGDPAGGNGGNGTSAASQATGGGGGGAGGGTTCQKGSGAKTRARGGRGGAGGLNPLDAAWPASGHLQAQGGGAIQSASNGWAIVFPY